MRFSSHGVRPAEAPGKKKKESQADARAGPRVASPAARFKPDHHGLVATSRHPAGIQTQNQS